MELIDRRDNRPLLTKIDAEFGQKLNFRAMPENFRISRNRRFFLPPGNYCYRLKFVGRGTPTT